MVFESIKKCVFFFERLSNIIIKKHKYTSMAVTDSLKSIEDAFVLGGIDLDPALDEIERDDGGVSDTA